MIYRADDVRVAYPLFQAEGGGSTPTSALQLCVVSIDVDTAISLNRLWHSRLPKLVRSNLTRCPNRVYYAAEYDGIYYAAAVWTNPVARLLPQHDWLELRRLAIAPDAPRNTASRMLSVMARLIRKSFPDVTRLVSYQDIEIHTGCIYRATGWQKTVVSDGGQWTRPSRKRLAVQSTAPKQRWEKPL